MKKSSTLFSTTLFSIIALAVMSFVSLPAMAGNIVINNIVVKGNQRVEKETIETFLGLEKGKSISSSELDQAFRRTYDTGLFEDIKINYDAGTVTVEVKENATVTDVEIRGNDKIEKDKILAELRIAPRSIYKEIDVKADVARIVTLYERTGRFNVKVEPKIEDLGKNRVKIVYQIDEGSKARVGQVTFINNSAFDEGRLQSEISTKESRWYRFFSGNDYYDSDRLEYDKELIRRFYVNNGYADIEVTSADAEYNASNKSFNIIFTLNEGEHFDFAEQTISSKIEDVNTAELLASIKATAGKEYDARKIEDTINNLTDALGDRGYAFVKIDPVYNRDENAKTIAINYEISKGPRVYVNRINVVGNVRTADNVIRREFRIAEGDPYNTSKIKRSKQRIEALGFFNKVDIQNNPTYSPDRVDLNVEVEEQSTGEVTFGAGFSSTEGVIGDVSVTERNLLGKGQYLKLNTTLATSRREIDLAFTEPYLFDRNFAGGFDIYSIKTDSGSYTSNLTFDSETTGTTLRGKYPISEFLSHDVNYTIRQDNIDNPQPGSSTFVIKSVGERITSSVGQGFTYNTLDNQFMPNKGWLASVNQDYAGVGGDVNYLKHEAKANYFTPISEELSSWIFRVGGRAGIIKGMGEDVRINDRFFIGSSVIRGFDNQGIGPRDKTTGDPLGGNRYYAAGTELMFPVGLPEELGVKGAVFADAASLTDTDENDPTLQIQDKSSLRTSAGAGVFWSSPLGPIRIDYATPISSESYDEEEAIRFSFGTRF